MIRDSFILASDSSLAFSSVLLVHDESTNANNVINNMADDNFSSFDLVIYTPLFRQGLIFV